MEVVRTFTGMLAEYTFTNLALSTKQENNESSRLLESVGEPETKNKLEHLTNAWNDCNYSAGLEWLFNKRALLSETEGNAMHTRELRTT